jgi:hypothetical protein
MARIGGDFSPPSMPSVESSPPPSRVESAPRVEEAPAPASKSENDIHAMPPTDSFERTSSPSSVSSTSAAEKPETKPVGAPSSGATKSFDSDTREEIKKLAGSENAEVQRNKDESETRTRKTEDERRTRERQLTEKKGLLREEQTRYTDSTTRTQQNGTVTKEKFTSESNTNLVGLQTSSNSVERSRTRGAVDSESGQTTNTTTRTTATDQAGIEKTTESRTNTIRQGTDDKNNVARSTTTSTTSDSLGNRQNSQETKTVTTNGKTTVTQTTKTSDGSVLSTKSSGGFKDGTLRGGGQVTFNNQNSITKSISRETEIHPEQKDKGFTQQRTDPLARAQQRGDALGARVTLAEGALPGDGKYKVTFGSDGLRASGNVTDGTSYKLETKTPDIQPGQAGYQVGAYVKREGTNAQGDATLNTNGLNATVNGRYGVQYEAGVTGRAQTASVNVAGVDMNASITGTAKVSGTLGADGTGTVQVTRNPPTAILEGRGGVSAVVKAEGETTISAGPFSVKANGYVSYGGELTGGGTIGYKDGKVTLGANFGAALGLGAGGGVTMQVDVAQIGQMAKNTAVRLGDANGDGQLGMDDVQAMANSTMNTARNTVNRAASTVRSWLGW